MARKRYKDFDAALAELEPISFKLNGVDYVLAKEPEAKVLLQMLSGDIDEDDVEKVLKEFLGAELYGRVLDDGATFRQLKAVCVWLGEQLSEDIEEPSEAKQSGEGGSSPPRSPSKRSSKSGRR